uniref:HAT C-terminal dimerisation domain-containing protein n=1 Tax=Megaselia scalaris TaxID=36166 RepID=T1GPP2_MEGSC
MYVNLIENLEIYKQLSQDKSFDIKPQVKLLINNAEFIKKIQTEIDIQNPICELINVCQKSSTNVGDAAKLWLNLKPHLSFNKKQKSSFDERVKTILTDCALSSYFLNPYNDLSVLSTEHLRLITNFMIKELPGNFIDQYLEYKKLDGIFKSYKAKASNVFDYWSLIQNRYPEIARIALRLLKIPASSAQLERVFSAWQHQHSELRNRLNFENSTMLMHIDYTYMLLDDENLDYDLEETEF